VDADALLDTARFTDGMVKAADSLQAELQGISATRAQPRMFDNVQVELPTGRFALNKLGHATLTGASMITINVFDPTVRGPALAVITLTIRSRSMRSVVRFTTTTRR
jgi:ribosome recycling factor